MVTVKPGYSSLDRRRFLLAGGSALTVGSLVCADWSGCPSDGRRPAWHPRSTGIHGEGRLVIRFDVDASSYQQTVLSGLDARLWCLCAGKLTERQIVEKVSSEQPRAMADLSQAVRRFLLAMYASGYVLPLRAGAVVPAGERQWEYPAGRSGELSRDALAGSHAESVSNAPSNAPDFGKAPSAGGRFRTDA